MFKMFNSKQALNVESNEITILAASLDLCLRKTRAEKSPDYRDVIVFEKPRFQHVFHPH